MYVCVSVFSGGGVGGGEQGCVVSAGPVRGRALCQAGQLGLDDTAPTLTHTHTSSPAFTQRHTQ